jgi:quercetin dioxygenase-like cupin family protein
MLRVLLALCTLGLATAPLAPAQTIRVVKFEDSKPFQMGSVVSRRIIHPELGAKNTTLNLSVSQPGSEFAQHTHDVSTDTILVLEGEVNLKQGDTLRLFRGGEAAYIPPGEIHGTVTAGTTPAVMISFQNPPDLVLYTGARDSSKTGAAPKGKITPGAVKYINFRDQNGRFLGEEQGVKVVSAYHRKLARQERISARVDDGGEAFFFVWRGAIRVLADGKQYLAGERDAVFIQGQAAVEVAGDGDGGSEVIQVHAPAQGK